MVIRDSNHVKTRQQTRMIVLRHFHESKNMFLFFKNSKSISFENIDAKAAFNMLKKIIQSASGRSIFLCHSM
jgi:hypothetical protein